MVINFYIDCFGYIVQKLLGYINNGIYNVKSSFTRQTDSFYTPKYKLFIDLYFI